jgi:hypothetical protein
LLHSQIGEQSLLAVSQGKQAVIHLGFLAEVNFEKMAMGSLATSTHNLETVELCFFLNQQQNPGWNQHGVGRNHDQLNRWNLAADAKRKKLLADPVIELNGPIRRTATARQSVAQGLLQLSTLEH